MRRWMVGILALVTLSGCAPTGQGAGAPGAPDDIELAAANVPRLASNAQDASNAGSAVNAFGLDLYRQVAAQDASANLVLSPASIALALAMARAGARGQTASEMDAVLHGLGTDEHAAWPAALDAALTARTGTFSDRDRRAGRRHPADRERALRPARHGARARLPRRARRPLRRRPPTRRLQARAGARPRPDQRLGRGPDGAADSAAPGARGRSRPDAPGARQRDLSQGRVAGPVRRRAAPSPAVHPRGRHDRRRAR